jgi:hypothetical protein
VGGVGAMSLEKHGVKGHRLHKLLETRPLEIEVIRGAPLHMLLLPPRSESNPDVEKRIIKKRIKDSKKQANKSSTVNKMLRPKLPTQKSNMSKLSLHDDDFNNQRRIRKHKQAQKEFFDDDDEDGDELSSANGSRNRSTFDKQSTMDKDDFSGLGFISVDESSKIPLLSSSKNKKNNALAGAGGANKRGSIFSAVKLMSPKTANVVVNAKKTSTLPPAQRDLRFFEVEMNSDALGAGIMDSIGCVEIISLIPNLEAERLGLKVGDLIMHINSVGFHPEKKCKRALFLKRLMREPRPLKLGIGRAKVGVWWKETTTTTKKICHKQIKLEMLCSFLYVGVCVCLKHHLLYMLFHSNYISYIYIY